MAAKKEAKEVRRGSKKILVSVIAVVVVVLIVGGLAVTGYLTFEPFSTKSSSLNRPNYCQDGQCVPDAVFSQLPPYPGDLEQIALLVSYNLWPGSENFSDKYPDYFYYTQPEFAWDATGNRPVFVDKCVDAYRRDTIGGYIGKSGFGAYPGSALISVTVNPAKEDVQRRVVTYVQAGCFVASWQGLTLIPIFPDYMEAVHGALIQLSQNPDNTRKYIKAEIRPDTLLIEPSVPFYPNWSQKVEVIVTVDKDTPPGLYGLGLDSINPPEELANMWFRKYRLAYTSGSGLSIGRPIYQVFVQVNREAGAAPPAQSEDTVAQVSTVV